jgi:hypothetical protein
MSSTHSIHTTDPTHSTMSRVSATADLKPKEHGAYAVLAIPSLTALAMGGVSLVGLCVLLAACCGFLAHEPLLVMLGSRGRRAQVASPDASRRWRALISATLLCGVLALLLGDPAVRVALLGCLVLAATNFGVSIAGRHRTFAGQLWGTVGLSAPCVPILLAAGVPIPASLAVWSVWLLGFAASTGAVRSVIAAQKRQPRWLHFVLMSAVSAVVIGLASRWGNWPLVCLPMLLASWWLMLAPPPVRLIRRVGWSLVTVTVATALLMVWTGPFAIGT